MNTGKRTKIICGFVVFLLVPLFCGAQIVAQKLKLPPDLTVSLTSKKGSTGLLIRSMQRVRVDNLGPRAASAFNVSLVLMKNKPTTKRIRPLSPRFTSVVIGKQKVTQLLAGRHVYLNFRAGPVNVPCGDYYLVAFADPENKVAESNESNNFDFYKKTILAHISSANVSGTGESYGGQLFWSLFVHGSRFGSTMGTKKVRIGASYVSVVPASDSHEWSDTQIIGDIGNECGHHNVYLTDGGKKLSNTVDVLVRAWIDLSPYSGSPGDEIELQGHSYGSSQGTKKVKFGSVEATVISWTKNNIRVTVPPLSPGTYEVWIEKNGENVSYGEDFVVH
jgi:hypothetical protein